MISKGVFLDFAEPLEVFEALLDIMYNDQIDIDRRLLLKVGRLSHRIKTYKVSVKIDAKLTSWYEGCDPVTDSTGLDVVVDDLVFCDNNPSFPLCWQQALDYVVRWYATYTKWDRYALHKGTNYNYLSCKTKLCLVKELLKDKVLDEVDECLFDYLGSERPDWDRYMLCLLFSPHLR